MNIANAKEQIKNAVTIYLQKDALGRYLVPLVHQRPIFLQGPPGLGKTAIMKQISEELKIGLVAYSMTHHTRQSAIGLPVIVEKEFGGKKYPEQKEIAEQKEQKDLKELTAVDAPDNGARMAAGRLFFYFHTHSSLMT